MKTWKFQKVALPGMVLVAVLLTVALPTRPALANADDENDKPLYINLTIINQSQFEITLSLYGPNAYEIVVPPDTAENYWLDRGWYAFTMGSCNLSETGTFDFTTSKTLHVPVCGATAGQISRSSVHLDSSDYIRPASIKIRNRTRQPVELYLRTLEEHHFMNFEAFEEQMLLIEDASQTFVYSYLACGELHAGYTRLYIHVPFDVKCNP